MNDHVSQRLILSPSTDVSHAAPIGADPLLQPDPLPTAAGVASSAPQEGIKPPLNTGFPEPAPVPTQVGPHGMRYDFNRGARVTLPEGQWRIQLQDLDTGNTLFDGTHSACTIMSSKRYYVRFGIKVWDTAGTCVLEHIHAPRDQDVLINFPVGTLGDTIAWFPYAVRFQQKHGCRLTCAMSALIIPLFRDAYPHIHFTTLEDVKPEQFYATYAIGLFFDDADNVWQPTDFRHVGLHRTAGYILGVDPSEALPTLSLPDDSRPIEEPYICIAVQASTQSKHWNNPTGWNDVIAFLKAQGFRVICIDQKAVHGTGLVWNHMPHGAEDQTGNIPLVERARWLRHATAFIGLSSGLAWLAWAAGCPVVLISGFTHPNNEFDTPFRIINWHTCNSCWNDVRHRFDHSDFLWCPRHANTPRQFECTRQITSAQVIQALVKIPGIAPTHS